MLSFIVLCVIYSVHSKTCNVLDYGAKGNGIADDTVAIQKAIDSCNDDTNTILFPSNNKFMIYPINFTNNNTQFVIDSNTSITAISDIKSWPINQLH